MPQQDMDELYEQIKATGKSGGVLVQGTVTERTLTGTARIIPPTRSQAELVNPPTSPTGDLPISNKELARFRSPKDYVDAARRHLEPESTGKIVADAFVAAVTEKDTKMLAILMPYLYGQPEKTQENQGTSEAFESLLQVLVESKPTKQVRPRRSQVIDGVMSDVLEEKNQDGKQEQQDPEQDK